MIKPNLFISLISTILLLFSGACYLIWNKKYPLGYNTDKEVLITSEKSTSVTSPSYFSSNSDVSTQRAYQLRIDKELENKDLTNSEKNLLLARKLTSIVIPRSLSLDATSFKDSKDLLDKLVFDKDIDKNSFGYNIAVASLSRSFIAWCYGVDLYGNYVVENGYQSVFGDYLLKYDDRQLATMLTFLKFMDNVKNSILLSDTTYNSVGAQLSAMTIRNYYKTLDKSDREYALNSLRIYTESYKNSKPLTYVTYTSGKLQPDFYNLVSTDIYKSNSGYTKSENKDIDLMYENLLSEIKNYKNGDDISKNVINIMVNIYYIDSIGRRYGKVQVESIKDKSIFSIIESINSNKEIQDVFAGFMRDGIYGQSKWEKTKTNFMSLANSNTLLENYFISIGIKKLDLEKIESDWK